MGDRRTFLIEHSFSSKYSGCDNRWHHVHLQIIKDQINLRVDTVDHKYFLSDNGHFTSARTSSPLYIGGLPGEWCAANFQILNTWAFLPSKQSFPNKNLDQGFIIIFHFYKSTTYLFHNSLSFYQKKKILLYHNYKWFCNETTMLLNFNWDPSKFEAVTLGIYLTLRNYNSYYFIDMGSSGRISCLFLSYLLPIPSYINAS